MPHAARVTMSPVDIFLRPYALSPSADLTPIQSRWLAEVVRRHEEHRGAVDDARIHADARAAAPDFEGRLLHRADALGAREG